MEGDTTASETRWPQLLDELLDRILARLSLRDIVSFGSVCKSWRSAVLSSRRFRRPPPLLATLKKRSKPRRFQTLFQTLGDDEEEREVSMLCFDDGKLHKLSMDFPVLVLDMYHKITPCLGNSYGWLLFQDPYAWRSTYYLLHPQSGERINLPSPTSHRPRTARVALSSPPTSGCCTFIAIIRTQDYFLLASWRRGDGDWTVFAKYDCSPTPFCMAFHRGELYVVLGKRVAVYRVDGRPKGPEFVGCVDDWVCQNHTDDSYEVYLVGGEELHLVVAMYGLTKFVVFKLDGRRWVKITDLGDHALFVGHQHTHRCRTSEIMGLGLRANCIYCLGYGPHGGQNLSVYSMEDGSIEELLQSADDLFLMPNEWDFDKGYTDSGSRGDTA